VDGSPARLHTTLLDIRVIVDSWHRCAGI